MDICQTSHGHLARTSFWISYGCLTDVHHGYLPGYPTDWKRCLQIDVPWTLEMDIHGIYATSAGKMSVGCLTDVHYGYLHGYPTDWERCLQIDVQWTSEIGIQGIYADIQWTSYWHQLSCRNPCKKSDVCRMSVGCPLDVYIDPVHLDVTLNIFALKFPYNKQVLEAEDLIVRHSC